MKNSQFGVAPCSGGGVGVGVGVSAAIAISRTVWSWSRSQSWNRAQFTISVTFGLVFLFVMQGIAYWQAFSISSSHFHAYYSGPNGPRLLSVLLRQVIFPIKFERETNVAIIWIVFFGEGESYSKYLCVWGSKKSRNTFPGILSRCVFKNCKLIKVLSPETNSHRILICNHHPINYNHSRIRSSFTCNPSWDEKKNDKRYTEPSRRQLEDKTSDRSWKIPQMTMMNVEQQPGCIKIWLIA